MAYDYTAGIDPGISGYCTILDDKGCYVTHFSNPVNTVVKKVTKRATGKVKTSTKTTLDIPKLVELLRPYVGCSFIVERQHPIPGQGLASTSKTMYGYGAILGVAHALQMRVNVISAKQWQKALLNPQIENTKEASVAFAQALHKGLDLRKTKRSKKADHNLADSLCIAHFGYLTFGNKNEGTNNGKEG